MSNTILYSMKSSWVISYIDMEQMFDVAETVSVIRDWYEK